MTENRRIHERRTTPPMASCEVICEPVDKKLDAIWDSVKTKTSMKLFYWCIGALAFFSVVLLGGMLWSFKDTLADLKTTAAVNATRISSINDSITRVGGEVKEVQTQVTAQSSSLERKFEKIENKIDYLHNSERRKNP